MQGQTVRIVSQAIRYIERHLHEKIDLEAEFRETENFYPLQLEIYLKEELVKMDLTKDNIKFATPEDADDWMELVSLTVDGYPCLDKKDYAANLHQYIADKKALILRDDDMAIGVMGFCPTQAV